MTLYLLRLKEIFTYRFAVAVVFIAPLVFGYFSGYAMSGKIGELVVAYVDDDKTAYSYEYIKILQRSGLSFTKCENRDEAEALTDRRKAEGVLIIKNGFEEGILNRKSFICDYTSAPGVSSAELVSEELSLAAVNLRSLTVLRETAGKLGIDQLEADEAFERNSLETPAISVESHGIQEFPLTGVIAPRHGAAALFMTLSMMFGALWLRSARHIARIAGKSAEVRDYFSAIAAILSVWAASILVYIIIVKGGLALFVNFAGLVIYCTGAGAFLSRVLKNGRDVVFAFIPFFMLNMTVGGALWGKQSDFLLLKIIAPVSMFLEGNGAVTAVAGLLLIIICGLVPLFSSGFRKSCQRF